MPTDEELMQAVGRGDLSAFEQVVVRHQKEAWSAAWRFLGDPAEAEDIAQEAFLTPEQAAEETAESKANMTDPASEIMKTRQGYAQGYNAQVVVTEEQYIVAPAVTTEANDRRQLHPMLNQAAANLEAVGVEEKIGAGLADAGYCSERNLTDGSPDGPELLVNTTKDWKRRKALRDAPPPRGRIPNGLTATERMERKLRTKRGAALYKKRAQTVEPVFGQIKDTRGLDRFSRRGASACESEWAIICATHNLRKLFRSGKAEWN